MHYDQHIDDAFGGGVRNEPQWNRILQKAQDAMINLQQDYASQRFPFLHEPSNEESMAHVMRLAAEVKDRGCRHLVLVGTGGSSFGANALASLERTRNSLREPFFHVLDNADPATAEFVYRNIEPEKTIFILISKSGGTAEVLMHAMISLQHMEKHVGRDQIHRHFYAITEPKQSALHDLAESYKIPIVPHDPNIGGRYSVMSVVGMFPAACIGIDVAAVREGAQTTLQQTLEAAAVDESHAALGAALSAYHLENGRPISTFMPYCDHLREFGDWYKQLVSESLGKQGKGITPLTARGAVDQHSMLQLFLEGPDDKWFTLVTSDQRGTGLKIEEQKNPPVPYLNGRTMGDVLEALQEGTTQTLIRNNRALRTIKMHDYTSAATMGALMMHWMLEVILTADIMGINPYDQPAVEEGKNLARSYLEGLK